MKEQFQPFYVGQEVEAIKDHSQGAFKKGDRFIVDEVLKSTCKCGCWCVKVGVGSLGMKTGECTKCGYNKIHIDINNVPFRHDRFRAITPAFQSITFEKVIEENPVSVC